MLTAAKAQQHKFEAKKTFTKYNLVIFLKYFKTYTAFSELFGINWGCEVESPSVICHSVFPVNKALWSLTNSSSCNDKQEGFRPQIS